MTQSDLIKDARKHIRRAWVIKDNDKISHLYGFYLADEAGGYSPRIMDAKLFYSRRFTKKYKGTGDKVMKVEISIREIKP